MKVHAGGTWVPVREAGAQAEPQCGTHSRFVLGPGSSRIRSEPPPAPKHRICRGHQPTPSPQRGSPPPAIGEISTGHGWWQTPACSGGICGVSSLPPASCLSSHKGNTAFWGGRACHPDKPPPPGGPPFNRKTRSLRSRLSPRRGWNTCRSRGDDAWIRGSSPCFRDTSHRLKSRATSQIQHF